ncbi:MAG: triose-phosphate isomerase [Candidatus Marinimicrobia bacterium]|nr:triose-phosphate isomerase [Candidatus Neomarinimicrobiota bacterium]|tara:strand:- start:19232 stop:20005 length:774 start_codon:yes stop_codon:yes gene_type:complete
MMRRPTVSANWKMFKTPNESVEFVEKLKKKPLDREMLNLILFAPYTSLFEMGNYIKSENHVCIGAQNLYWESEGAFTGEISANMIKACNTTWVIVGHSERRTLFNESDEIVCRKAIFALKNNLSVTFCVGESLNERESGQTELVLRRQLGSLLSLIDSNQLKRIIIAYEPIWAIGTGLTANVQQISQAHEILRGLVNELFGKASDSLTIQYGGSVNEKNCRQLSEIDEVDGFLIGGASLDVNQFFKISETIAKVKKI